MLSLAESEAIMIVPTWPGWTIVVIVTAATLLLTAALIAAALWLARRA